MYPIVYRFQPSIEDYREMSFYSTFSFRRGQNTILLIAWIASTVSFFLDVSHVIALSETVHVCVLMIMVTLPMLFVSVLANVYRFKRNGSDYRKKVHTVLLGKETVQYEESGNINTGTDKWDDIAYAIETSHLFLLYRTPNNAVLLPKRNVPEQQISETRACLKEKLGVRFKVRCRIK